MTTDELALDLPTTASIRRAVLIGVLRSGLAAAVWLLVAAMLAFFAVLGLNAVRTEHFHDVSFHGAQVGRPEYRSNGGGCCSENLGLTNSLELDLHVRGSVGPAAPVTGRVRQNLLGSITADLPPTEDTPIGAALSRDRPPKDGTRAFADSLPASASVTAVVEFADPLSAEAYLAFPGSSGDAVLLADPYAEERPVSWSAHDLDGFRRWVATLSTDDDDSLDKLGSPPVSQLRATAKDPHVHAFVLETATAGQVRDLLADPRVRSVNIADVGFDPIRQFPAN